MRGFALPLSSFREMRFRMRILLEWLQLRLVAQTAHAQRDTGTAGDSLIPISGAARGCRGEWETETLPRPQQGGTRAVAWEEKPQVAVGTQRARLVTRQKFLEVKSAF